MKDYPPVQALRAHPKRIMFIEGQDNLITGGQAYLSRSGQSVAVTLYGPRDPRDPDAYPVPRHRVYLPVEMVEGATKPAHLLNAAQHKATRWLDDCKADYWHGALVVACRPLRAHYKPLLQAIAKTAHNRWGHRYWRNAEARAMLDRELRLIGVKMPPPVSAIRFREFMRGEKA